MANATRVGATDKLHTIEKFRRVAEDTLEYYVTFDDPDCVVAPVDADDSAQDDWRADVRVRVPRGELRSPRDPPRGARARSIDTINNVDALQARRRSCTKMGHPNRDHPTCLRFCITMSPFDLLAIVSVLGNRRRSRPRWLPPDTQNRQPRPGRQQQGSPPSSRFTQSLLIVVSLVSPKKVLDIRDGSVFRRMVHHGHQRVSAAKHR